MSLMVMSFMGISFLVIKYAGSMFRYVWCTPFIQKYQTVKIFPSSNQSPVVAPFLGIVLLIPVTSIWSWTLPQGIFTLSITWCLTKTSVLFSVYMMMNNPQYSVTTFPLNHSLIKFRWDLNTVLYFMMNRSRNADSFNLRTTFMPLIKPTRLHFVWRILSRLCLVQYLFPQRILLSFRNPQLLHLCLLLLSLPLQSQFWSPLVAELKKTKGTLTSKKFQDEIYPPRGAWYFLANLTVPTQHNTDSYLDYTSDINTDYDTGIINCSDPRDFFDKTIHKDDPENPSYNEAMTGTYAREYKISMHKDILHLIKQSTRCMTPHNTIQKLTNEEYHVLPVT